MTDYVRFSNRPVWVKHFRTIHDSSVDVAHGGVCVAKTSHGDFRVKGQKIISA